MRQNAPTATWAAETGLHRTQQLLLSVQTPVCPRPGNQTGRAPWISSVEAGVAH